jgi:hypothetical protein
MIVVILGMNGETNWFEGALLLALYVILGIAFFYVPRGVEVDVAAAPTRVPVVAPAAAAAAAH